MTKALVEVEFCSINGCGDVAHTRGWCRAHYMRWWTHGDALYGGEARVDKHGGISKRSRRINGTHRRCRTCRQKQYHEKYLRSTGQL
jgi:hypothetical protein